MMNQQGISEKLYIALDQIINCTTEMEMKSQCAKWYDVLDINLFENISNEINNLRSDITSEIITQN